MTWINQAASDEYDAFMRAEPNPRDDEMRAQRMAAARAMASAIEDMGDGASHMAIAALAAWDAAQ